MQKEAIWKSKRIMPNRRHKCCKNYTYVGFVNKTNKNKEKDVSKVEQIKEEKKNHALTCVINHIAIFEKVDSSSSSSSKSVASRSA